MSSFADVAECVIEGDFNNVTAQVQSLLDAGEAPLDIINKGLIEGMNVVGVRFKSGEMFVPEVLKCARTMAAGVELVKPLIKESDEQSKGKVVLGTVRGDLHDIGKNLVGMMLESAGLEVINLGVDLAPEKFVEAIKEHKPQIIAMSALLTTTMPAMKETIETITANGLRDTVKIIVGGAPITKEFAESIGADGYAPDAAYATDLCREIIGV